MYTTAVISALSISQKFWLYYFFINFDIVCFSCVLHRLKKFLNFSTKRENSLVFIAELRTVCTETENTLSSRLCSFLNRVSIITDGYRMLISLLPLRIVQFLLPAHSSGGHGPYYYRNDRICDRAIYAIISLCGMLLFHGIHNCTPLSSMLFSYALHFIGEIKRKNRQYFIVFEELHRLNSNGIRKWCKTVGGNRRGGNG